MEVEMKQGTDYRGRHWKSCPKCGSKSFIDIEPFEGSGYWCPKCKNYFEFKGIC